MERVEYVLEKIGIKYDYHKNDDGTWYGLVEFWTDVAGQDIPIEFEFDGTAESFVEEFSRVAEMYDVDEEVELYANSRGKNGVPSTIRELLDDCQEAKDTLMKIMNELKEICTVFDFDKMFITDQEKMYDFKKLSRKEFLELYSYLTEEEYDETARYVDWLMKG